MLCPRAWRNTAQRLGREHAPHAPLSRGAGVSRDAGGLSERGAHVFSALWPLCECLGRFSRRPRLLWSVRALLLRHALYGVLSLVISLAGVLQRGIWALAPPPALPLTLSPWPSTARHGAGPTTRREGSGRFPQALKTRFSPPIPLHRDLIREFTCMNQHSAAIRRGLLPGGPWGILSPERPSVTSARPSAQGSGEGTAGDFAASSCGVQGSVTGITGKCNKSCFFFFLFPW